MKNRFITRPIGSKIPSGIRSFPIVSTVFLNIKHWPHGPVTNATHYGGNLKGIIDKLPYLAQLGITGLYLTPVFESPSTHKYDTTDYFRIDPEFGTMDDLKDLVKQAHELKIKVMLDAVFTPCRSSFQSMGPGEIRSEKSVSGLVLFQ